MKMTDNMHTTAESEKSIPEMISSLNEILGRFGKKFECQRDETGRHWFTMNAPGYFEYHSPAFSDASLFKSFLCGFLPRLPVKTSSGTFTIPEFQTLSELRMKIELMTIDKQEEVKQG